MDFFLVCAGKLVCAQQPCNREGSSWQGAVSGAPDSLGVIGGTFLLPSFLFSHFHCCCWLCR